MAICGAMRTRSAQHSISVIAPLCVQAELQKKYELLGQLEERYGEDLIGDEQQGDGGQATLDWQENGDLSVQVIEGSMLALSKCKATRVSVKLTIHGKQGYGKTKSTAWASSRTPWWSEAIGFEHCQRQDVMVVQVWDFCIFHLFHSLSLNSSPDTLHTGTGVPQVFEQHRFGADLLLGQCLLPLHHLPRGGRPRYQWVEILSLIHISEPTRPY